jgi:hypothetical protein
MDDISQMTLFKQELEKFLKSYGLPTPASARPNGWANFVRLYASVVQDCPLVMTSKNPSASIESVTLRMEEANQTKAPFCIAFNSDVSTVMVLRQPQRRGIRFG